ncbi:hypothetical protein RvY_09277-2 [Ramazzottius varieornatus]|uniref:Exportin-4 n=1 Tax=Ramazzottius varieornatus TaxID=947166 RepID=A0A1D1VGQ2_RAMVA|nr:hypothetical protein RvY_09277-2 [Ramazzottius varieornatus]
MSDKKGHQFEENIVQQHLTDAANRLCSPDVAGTPYFKEAETVFTEFRLLPEAQTIAVRILQSSEHPYVQFQCLCAIQDRVVKSWSSARNDAPYMVQAILQFCFERTERLLSNYFVYQKGYNTVVIICKKAMTSSPVDVTSELVDTLLPFLHLTDLRRLHALNLLTHLLTEFSLDAFTDLGMPMSTHMQTHISFQERYLLRVWKELMGMAPALLQPTGSEVEYRLLLKAFLSSLTKILSWNFTGHTQAELDTCSSLSADSEGILPFDPPKSWRMELVHMDNINAFFRMYDHVKHDQELSLLAMECLSRLGSLAGSDCLDGDDDAGHFPGDDIRVAFSGMFLSCLIRMDLSSLPPEICNGLSLLFYHLTYGDALSVCIKLDMEIIAGFYIVLCTCTKKIGKSSLSEENSFSDERPFSSAFERLLSCWAQVVEYNSSNNEYAMEGIGSIVQGILEQFMKMHLSPPLGNRQLNARELNEDIKEIVESDRLAYSGQLECIGQIARFCPRGTITFLSDLSDHLLGQLRSSFEILPRDGFARDQWHTKLNDLLEDLNWTIAATGSFLFGNEQSGDSIPIGLLGNVGETCDLQLLNALYGDLHQFDMKTVHPVPRDSLLGLVFRMLRLSQLLLSWTLSGHKDFLSPEIVISMLWFESSWVQKYFVRVDMFTNSSDEVRTVVRLLTRTAVCYLKSWTGEEELCKEAVKLIGALARHSELNILAEPEAQALVQDFVNLEVYIRSLPGTVKKDLAAAVATAVRMMPGNTDREDIWNRIVGSLKEKMNVLLLNKAQIRMDEVADICDIALGLASCMAGTIKDQQLSHQIYLLTEPCLQLAKHGSADAEMLSSALEMFDVNVSVSDHLSVEERLKLLGSLRILAELWVTTLCGSHRLHDGEERLSASFSSLVCTLTSTMGKQPSQECLEETRTTIRCLLKAFLQSALQDRISLSMPEISENFFSMMRNVCQFAHEVISDLDDEYCQIVCTEIERSFTAGVSASCSTCAAFLCQLGFCIARMPVYEQSSSTSQKIIEIARVSIRMLLFILFQPNFPTSAVFSTAEALFGLLCCHKNEYNAFVEGFVRSVPINEQRDAVVEQIQALVPTTLTLVPNNACASVFQKHFVSRYYSLRNELAIK